MSEEELLKRISELEIQNCELETQNKKLKEKLIKRNKRKRIKTTKEEIINYWISLQDECDLSFDWAEAGEICWRCGCEKKLQKCHIIPDSLGGKDEPSNLVLLCTRCHIDAPNVESKTFMWDWIKANKTSFYNTFWYSRATKEYEFIYGKTFHQELLDRDIISNYDRSLFWSLPIGKSIHHFAHPWNNESTDAGLLRMRIEEFDRRHPIIKKKSHNFRQKEKDFDNLIFKICDIAKKYKFNLWEGCSKNRFSFTLSTFIDSNKKIKISVKLCRDKFYRACFTNEANPNNNLVSDYTLELGNEENVINFIIQELEKFTSKFGIPEKQEYIFTNNPFLNNIIKKE